MIEKKWSYSSFFWLYDKMAKKKRDKRRTAHAQSRRTFVIGGEIKKTTTDQGASFSDFKKAINKIRNA